MKNMTEGEPLKLIIPFMIPLLIGNVFQQLYNIADIIIVGRTIGVNALAAVGATAPLFMMLVILTLGMSGGSVSLRGSFSVLEIWMACAGARQCQPCFVQCL